MKRFVITIALWTGGTLALHTGCSPSPVMRPRTHDTKVAADDWQRSATWLYATDKSRSGHAPECQYVRKLLDDESNCKGRLCRHPAELAAEWLDKCAELMPDGVDEISGMEAALSDQANAKPSKCSKQLKRFMDDGCDKEHCAEDAQEWATRCGQTEGSPLVMSILAKVVTRHMDASKPIKLDARSCESLNEQVLKLAHCQTETACKKAWKTLETQKQRCIDPNETPDIATAMREVSIAVGAVRELDDEIEIAAEPERLGKGDIPLVLADGTGGVFAVCHQRVTELDKYLEARAACDGGFVQVAQASGEDDEREILMGEIPVRKGWDILDMFPSFAVVGENLRVDKRRSQALAEAIDAAIEAKGTKGLAKLVVAIDAEATGIFESKRIRQVLADRDDELLPLFEAAARAKVTDGKPMSANMRRGLAFRAKDYPLSDVSREGKVSIRDRTRAAWLETEDLLPKATAAYRSKLVPLHKEVRLGSPLRRDAGGTAATAALAAAKQCALAQEDEATAREQVVQCVFDECDDERIQQLVENRDQAAVNAEAHLHALLLAVSSVESEQLDTIADTADCELPSFDD